MFELWMILGMFTVTFGVRYPVLAFVSRITLPELVMRALVYVPPAVLAAIIAPEILMPDDQRLNLAPTSPHLLAAAAAALVSYKTRNLLLTILVGMGVFLGLRALL